MGFTSRDNWIANQTNLGAAVALQTCHAEWEKQNFAAYSAGRWFDLNLGFGTPPFCQYGELTLNPGPFGSANNWQTNTQWSYAAVSGQPTGSFVRAGTGAGQLTQTAMEPLLQNGHTYKVIWNISAISGTLTLSLNGADGLPRSVLGTYVETITVGAGTGGLAIRAAANGNTATIQGNNNIPHGISVFEERQSYQLTDTDLRTGALYHGGNVSTKTKHIFNAGVISVPATTVPMTYVLCDFLLAYPGIDMNSIATQTLLNDNALPRYTDGTGVRAYIVASNVYQTVGAYAGQTDMSYTNSAGTAGKALPVQVDNTVGCVVGQIIHTGTNENNYAPFLPRAEGDMGVRSVQSVTYSAATDNPYKVIPNAFSYSTLVLAKPLMYIPVTGVTIESERDLMYQLPALPRVVDGAYLGWLAFPGNTTAINSNVRGYIDFSWA